MSYPGGKNAPGVYQSIINLIPPHEVYIEPFLGSGAILRLKRPAAVSLGIDLDPAALELAVKAFTAESGEAAGIVEIGGARVPPHLVVSADTATSGDTTRLSDGDRRVSPSSAVCDRAAASPTVMLGPGPNFLCGDGISVLERWKWTGREFVYCDPPYLLSTRASKRAIYRCEMDVVDHRRLLRVVMGLPCSVMISGYWSELYGRTLAAWHTATFPAVTRGGRKVTEWLWCNYPPPPVLHDWRFLGSDYRERERIRRRVKRWTERIRRIPKLERQALLSALQDASQNPT